MEVKIITETAEIGAVKRKGEVTSTSSGIETGLPMDKPKTGALGWMQAGKTGRERFQVQRKNFYETDKYLLSEL